jgi:hypothetical protein
MRHTIERARAPRPGVVVSVATVFLCALVAACGARGSDSSAERRTWEGPGAFVASTGTMTHERREIAQRVPIPLCIEVGDDRYQFTRVSTYSGAGLTPPGLTDTFFRLDRWRIWTRGGPIQGQPALFVTIRGSTGILAEYERLPADQPCAA